jgi:hypothetical protein
MDDDLKEEIKKGKKLSKTQKDAEIAAEKQQRAEELAALKQAMIDSGQWEEPAEEEPPADEPPADE